MSEQPLRLLATADVHLGRRSTHLSDSVSVEDAATRSVWQDIIELAIKERVNALLLAGDIVDSANKYFEAWGPLEAGVLLLREAGIQTFAVAGNHDHDVFPRLMDTLGADIFTLLGQEGSWDTTRIKIEGKTACQLAGWSFPKAHWPENPLNDFNLELDPDVPAIGLLHTQLDDAQQRYAPVSLSDLGRYGVHVWVLGHVHRSQPYDCGGGSRAFYCGSPQAMDPGETGPHGVHLITVQPDGQVDVKQRPLSRVRYATLDVDVRDGETVEDVESTVSRRFSEFADDIADEDDDRLRALSVRVRLVGQCPCHSDLDSLTDRVQGELTVQRNDFEAFVDDLTVATEPAIDIDSIAANQDLAGELARLIIALESGNVDEVATNLLRDVEEDISNWQQPVWEVTGEPTGDLVRQELLAETRTLLGILVAERRGG